jgi:hypothetical protein
MCDPGFRVMLARKVMGLFFVQFIGKDMLENFGTEGFQQVILRFKMRVECRSSHIRQIDDLLNGDFRVVLFLQKLREGPKNGLPALSLSAVHRILPEQFCMFCSVSNDSGILIIVGTSAQAYNNNELSVR